MAHALDAHDVSVQMSDWQRLAQTLSLKHNQPQVTYETLADLARDRVGFRLFTIMEIDQKADVARRSYSSMPEAYPVTGEKPLHEDAWSECVRIKKQIFIANSIAEIAAVFSDHEHIKMLGCASCMNLPIVVCGEVIGTLNFLHEAGYYHAQRIAAAQSLAWAGTLALLVAQTYPKEIKP